MDAYKLAEQLKNWSGNRDELWNAANMLRQQADRIAELEKEKDKLEKLVHQRFDDGKRLGILDTELKYKFAPQTKPLSDEEIINCYAPTKYYSIEEKGLIDFARTIEAKVRGEK